MITLNPKQQSTLDDFIQTFKEAKSDKQSLLYQISGPAGTGKTELTRHAIEELSDYSIIVCAPTHKACQVLQERLHGCSIPITTCHQFLDAKPMYNSKGESKWRFKTKTVDIPDLLIIDEVSMINEELYRQFEWLIDNRKACILTLGDRCQLPPVLEEETLFYTQHSIDAELTQNMRNAHKQYNRLLNRLREFIVDPKEIPNFTLQQFLEWLSSYTQVYSLQEGSMRFEHIPRSIIQSFQQTGASVMLAHRTNARNNTVQQLNEYIRTHIFKERAQDTFTEQEQLIFTDYFVAKQDQIFYTNDRAIIKHIQTDYKPFYNKTFLVYDLELECKQQSEEPIHVFYIHKTVADSFREYQKQIQTQVQEQVDRIEAVCKQQCPTRCATHRKEIDELWKTFHESKKQVWCPIDYAYCLSIHKSQGSTYENVYLFLSDFIWMLRMNQLEFFKLLYVGMSRAKMSTIVF